MTLSLSSGATLMILVSLPADQFGDEGFAPDAFALFAEFEIAPDERADGGGVGVVKIRRVVAGIRRAGRAHAELRGEPEKSRGAQIVRVLVPDDDVIRRHARVEQPVNHRRHDRRARAADFAGFGTNLDADDILRGDEAPPRLGDVCLAREIREAAVDHVLNDGGVRLEIGNGAGFSTMTTRAGAIGGAEGNMVRRRGRKTK